MLLERFCGTLADRMILGPTRHAIPAPNKAPVRLPFGDGHLELWAESSEAPAGKPGPVVLKFPGTESRAEDAESLALRCWNGSAVTVWSVNPPGYGASSGRASLANIPAMATAAVAAIREVVGEQPIVAEGFSLGCVAALYLGAQGRVEGLLLRNPPPLRELIRYRTGWWSLDLVPALLARGIPNAIDSIANAAGCKVPALFLTAFRDQVVPVACQYRIIDAYGGDRRVLEQPQGGHATPLSDAEMNRLKQLAGWLLDNLKGRYGSP